MQFCTVTLVASSVTSVIIIKNETASTAVFVDYWALAKICFFIFVSSISVVVLFFNLIGYLRPGL